MDQFYAALWTYFAPPLTTELEKSDSRRWFLRCPSCGRENIAQWANVQYKNRRAPIYVMPCCGGALDSVRFRHAVDAGRWKPTQAEAVPGTRGFHLDAFLSPFESLPTIVRQWRRADAHRKQTGSMAEVITFQCGRLALPYKPEAAQGVTPNGLATSCREDYDHGAVPAEASVIVGVDVQDNRLEAELSAWGMVEVERDDAGLVKGWGSHEFRGLMHDGRWYRLRRWALDYRRFHGDPGNPALWEKLAAFMETPRPHARDGADAAPRGVGIDSGGHYTQQVAEFVRVRGSGYQALKGLPPQRFGAVLARRGRSQPTTLRPTGARGCCWYAATAARRPRSPCCDSPSRARNRDRWSGRWTNPGMGRRNSRASSPKPLCGPSTRRPAGRRLYGENSCPATNPSICSSIPSPLLLILASASCWPRPMP